MPTSAQAILALSQIPNSSPFGEYCATLFRFLGTIVPLAYLSLLMDRIFSRVSFLIGAPLFQGTFPSPASRNFSFVSSLRCFPRLALLIFFLHSRLTVCPRIPSLCFPLVIGFLAFSIGVTHRRLSTELSSRTPFLWSMCGFDSGLGMYAEATR